MIDIKNINKTYHSLNGDSCKALNNISLKFGEKGLVFITGKSGSGKSTLLNILGGLDQVDSGDIKIKDKSSSNFTREDFDSFRNTYLGFIFQDFGILENLTVSENISLALKLQGYQKNEINEKLKEIIDQVGLSGYGKRTSNELSGGQLQRVSIARALVKNPEIILADEPTGNLDSKTGKQIMDLLKKLSKTKLVIVVSHDLDFANQYADRIITLKDGSVIEDNKITKKLIRKKIKVPKTINYTLNKDLISDKEFVLKKTNLPSKYILKSALSSISRRKVKLIFTIFLFIVSLYALSISTLVSNYDISKSMINTMKYNDEDSILVRKCDNFGVDYTKEYNIDNCLFRNITDYETRKIQKLVFEHNAISYNLINQLYPLKVKNHNNYYEPSRVYGFIELSTNHDFEIIDGTFPTSPNEVMITDYLVEPLKNNFNISDNELIGSSIKYAEKVYTITGIIDTDYEQFEYLKDIDLSQYNEQELKEIKYDINKLEFNQEKLFSRLLKLEQSETKSVDYVDDVKLWTEDEIFLGFINFATDDYLKKTSVLTYPSQLPQLEENDIYIDLNLFIERILSYQSDVDVEDYSLEKIISNLSVLEEFIGQTYTVNHEYKNVKFSEDLTIRGFFVPNEEQEVTVIDNTILASTDIVNKIPIASTTYDGYYVELSNSTNKNVKLINLLNEKGNIQVSPYSNDLYFVSGVTKDLHNTLYYITSGLALFACVLIFVSISNSVIEKQKDIGILMSIGTKGTDIGSIFIIESIILALISSVIAVIIAYISTFVINHVLMNHFGNSILFFQFGIKEIISVVTLATLMSIISTIVPFIRLVLMKPINVVRKK